MPLLLGDLQEKLDAVVGQELADINSPEFKKWFKNSKVVDSSGKPLVVYHGTDQNFNVFRTDQGAWFISNKDESAEYGKHVIPVYISIKNPYKSSHQENVKIKIQRLISKAKASGYDGIYIPKDISFHTEHIYTEALYDVYVVFSPSQIKSIYNNGEWNTNSDNIYEEKSVVEEVKSFFKQDLSEKFTDIVYHNTTVRNLHKILDTSVFQLTPVFSRESDMELQKIAKNRIFYASFTRSPYAYKEDTIIKLDGRKLGYKYKALPVDYWQDLARRINAKVGVESIMMGDEMEDRLISKEPEIKDFDKYILEIHVKLYDKPKDIGNAAKEQYLDIYKYCTKAHIPVFFYTKDNASAFKILDKRKATLFFDIFDIDEFKTLRVEEYPDESAETKRKIAIQRYLRKKEHRRAEGLGAVVSVWYAKKPEDVPEAYRDHAYYTRIHLWDKLGSIQADLQNAIRWGRGDRKLSVEIARLVHKYGDNSLKKFLEGPWREKYDKLFFKKENHTVDDYIVSLLEARYSVDFLKKKYVDTNEISPERFEKLKEIDPTKDKKYLEWLCRMQIKDDYYIDELPDDIEAAVHKFSVAATRNYIKGREKDINSYKSFDDFMNAVDKINVHIGDLKPTINFGHLKPNTDYEIVFENDKSMVILLKTYRAAQQLCDDSYCIQHDKGMWDDQYEDKDIIVFLVFDYEKWRSATEKMWGISIKPDGNIHDLSDGKNRPMLPRKTEFTSRMKELDIPLKAFDYKDIYDLLSTNRFSTAIEEKDYSYFYRLLKNHINISPKMKATAEAILAESPQYAVRYVSDVTKKPFPEAEDAISKDAKQSYVYAIAIKKPFPKGEKAIASDFDTAYNYALYVLKGRFEKGELIISTDPTKARNYAIDILQSRFPQGEKAIATHGDVAYTYALFLRKKGIPIPEVIHNAIIKHPMYAPYYAKELGTRLPEAEDYIAFASQEDIYEYIINTEPRTARVSQTLESVIAKYGWLSQAYARILKQRFEAGEPAMLKAPLYAERYVDDVLIPNNIPIPDEFKQYDRREEKEMTAEVRRFFKTENMLRESVINRLTAIRENKHTDMSTTGNVYYDRLMSDPPKGIQAEVEYISPEVYLQHCATVHDNTYEDELSELEQSRIDQMVDAIRDKDEKLPIAVLDLAKNGQDGRHRAGAFQRLGVDNMPVLFIRKADVVESIRYFFEARYSVATLQKKYVDDGKLVQSTFDMLKDDIDPTKDKKYLHWLCKTLEKTTNLGIPWKFGEYHMEDLQAAMQKFTTLADRNIVKGSKKDIYSYKSFEDFIKEMEKIKVDVKPNKPIINTAGLQEGKGEEGDYEEVFDSDLGKIFLLKTFDAAQRLCDSSYCIQHDELYWSKYVVDGKNIFLLYDYALWDSENEKKWGIVINKTNDVEDIRNNKNIQLPPINWNTVSKKIEAIGAEEADLEWRSAYSDATLSQAVQYIEENEEEDDEEEDEEQDFLDAFKNYIDAHELRIGFLGEIEADDKLEEALRYLIENVDKVTVEEIKNLVKEYNYNNFLTDVLIDGFAGTYWSHEKKVEIAKYWLDVFLSIEVGQWWHIGDYFIEALCDYEILPSMVEYLSDDAFLDRVRTTGKEKKILQALAEADVLKSIEDLPDKFRKLVAKSPEALSELSFQFPEDKSTALAALKAVGDGFRKLFDGNYVKTMFRSEVMHIAISSVMELLIISSTQYEYYRQHSKRVPDDIIDAIRNNVDLWNTVKVNVGSEYKDKVDYYDRVIRKQAMLMPINTNKTVESLKYFFEQELFEKIHDTVYIKTIVPYLQSILSTNKMVLKKNSPQEKDRTGRDYHGIFFASPHEGSLKKLSGNTIVVVDGDKLNQSYAGEWETLNDHLYSNKPAIDNFSKYIKEVHILALDENKEKEIKELVAELIKNHIPVFVYNNLQHFKAMFKSKAQTGKDMEVVVGKQKRYTSTDISLAKFYLNLFYDIVRNTEFYKLSRPNQTWLTKTNDGKNMYLIRALVNGILRSVKMGTTDNNFLKIQSQAEEVLKSVLADVNKDTLQVYLLKKIKAILSTKREKV